MTWWLGLAIAFVVGGLVGFVIGWTHAFYLATVALDEQLRRMGRA